MTNRHRYKRAFIITDNFSDLIQWCSNRFRKANFVTRNSNEKSRTFPFNDDKGNQEKADLTKTSTIRALS